MRANAALVANRAVVIGLAIQQKTMAVWTGVVTAAQWAWNAALTANPIGLVITGITAFGAIAYTVYKKWEPIKLFFKELWGTIKSGLGSINEVGSAISGFFGFGDNTKQAPTSSESSHGGNKKAAAVLGVALAAPATASLPANVTTETKTTAPIVNNQQYHINVTQLPGEDAEQLARRITEIQQENAMRGETDVR